MNWPWNVRSNNVAMNGQEFARCTTAGGLHRVLIRAAPGRAAVEIIDGEDRAVARASLDALLGARGPEGPQGQYESMLLSRQPWGLPG
jgi:hypothetical protein